MRRGPGIGGLLQRRDQSQQYSAVGKQLESEHLAQLQQQLKLFQSQLQSFAAKHKAEINQHPIFRAYFTQACTKIGVDPLSSSKGFWSALLGVGDFYFELSVQIAMICMASRSRNGGIMSMTELVQRVNTHRHRHRHSHTAAAAPTTADTVTDSDIKMSVKKMAPLGSGFRLIELPSLTLIQSVPQELNNDEIALLSLLKSQSLASFDLRYVRANMVGWDESRVQSLIALLVNNGLVWVDGRIDRDSDNVNQPVYYFYSLFLEQRAQKGAITDVTDERTIS